MKKKGKIISLALVLVLVIGVLATACTKEQSGSAIEEKLSVLPKSVTTKLSDIGNPVDAFNDVKNVDLMHKLDEKGLTVKNEKDDETDTSIDYMYKGDTLVYARYNDYSEDGFDYYTKSASGKDIKVHYTDMNDKRYSVTIYADNYFISFDELKPDSELGAENVQIIIEESADKSEVSRSAAYYISPDDVSVTGYYFDNVGYHRFSAYPNGVNYDTDDDVIFDKEYKIKVDDIDFNTLSKDERINVLQITLGKHELKYVEAENGTKEWYLEADVMAVCKDRKAALAVLKDCRKYNVELEETEDKWVVDFDDVVFPISDKFEDFGEFAVMEIDDYYYAEPVLDENNALSGFSRDNIMMSYY